MRKMLAKSEQIDIIYIEVTYRYRCRKCSQIFSDWDKYVEHAKLTSHMGIILQVDSNGYVTELP